MVAEKNIGPIDRISSNDVLCGFVAADRKYIIVNCTTGADQIPNYYASAGTIYVDGTAYPIFEVQDPDHEDVAQLLTERELQIAVLVAQGLQTKRIAYLLKISEWTVSAHLRRIFTKLRVESRAAMVYRCAGLIHRSEPVPKN
jgi:DNA-binding CsgD family transcriptional regulator